MIITQDRLIKQIAKKEGISVSAVRNIFKSAESLIFEHLTSITPSENIVIKVLNGITLERKYLEEQKLSKGMFADVVSKSHVNVKPYATKHFSKKVNELLFQDKIR